MVLTKPTLLDSTDMVREIKELLSEYEEEKKEKEEEEKEEEEKKEKKKEKKKKEEAEAQPGDIPPLLFLTSELAESIAAGESALPAFGILGKLYDIGSRATISAASMLGQNDWSESAAASDHVTRMM
jgi:hypothetical protein